MKAGKVISSANLAKINTAIESLQSVVASMPDAPDQSVAKSKVGQPTPRPLPRANRRRSGSSEFRDVLRNQPVQSAAWFTTASARVVHDGGTLLGQLHRIDWVKLVLDQQVLDTGRVEPRLTVPAHSTSGAPDLDMDFRQPSLHFRDDVHKGLLMLAPSHSASMTCPRRTGRLRDDH
jgi:hypothetical protein